VNSESSDRRFRVTLWDFDKKYGLPYAILNASAVGFYTSYILSVPTNINVKDLRYRMLATATSMEQSIDFARSLGAREDVRNTEGARASVVSTQTA